ncbi:MAG: response regulator transcription factor [Thermoplasmatota archaeon]
MTKILVVDESASIRMVLRRAILATGEARDEDVLEATDPDEAEKIFFQEAPDMVFTDLMLGEGLDGLEVIDRLLQKKPETHMVVVSALPQEEEDVRQAFAIGAFAYVAKPIRGEALRRVFHDYHEEEEGRMGRIRPSS